MRVRESHFTASVALKDNAVWPVVPVVIVTSIMYWAEWAADEVSHYYELKRQLFIVIPLTVAAASAKPR